MKAESYKKLLKNVFEFLVNDYGFRLVECEDDRYFYKLIYKNSTTGVTITYEYKDANIFVRLFRLVDGQLVEDKTPISRDVPLNSIDLNYIVQYRAPQKVTKPLYDSSVTSFKGLVTDLANNLKTFADDVLNGKFSIFAVIDDIAKKRRLEWQNSG